MQIAQYFEFRFAHDDESGACELFYWRDRNREVDFVVRAGRTLTAIEVKSGRGREAQSGLATFQAAFPSSRVMLVGGDGIAIEDLLEKPVERWVKR